MRKLLVLPLVVVVVLIPVVAFASGSGTSPVSTQELAWDTSAISTSSTSWTSIPALSGEAGGCNVATFSAEFVGGQETNNEALTIQVEWRLVASGASTTLKAGSVVVLPGGDHCG
jgi:hypothetical protein